MWRNCKFNSDGQMNEIVRQRILYTYVCTYIIYMYMYTHTHTHTCIHAYLEVLFWHQVVVDFWHRWHSWAVSKRYQCNNWKASCRGISTAAIRRPATGHCNASNHLLTVVVVAAVVVAAMLHTTLIWSAISDRDISKSYPEQTGQMVC